MDYIGIDIGSTAAKIVVRGDHAQQMLLPTGWSSRETARLIEERLRDAGVPLGTANARTVATGYGRNAVAFADRQVTEITCHARGSAQDSGGTCTVIDVGGQDTKVIRVEDGVVSDFLMNDKCAAGTGKFIEIMANRLNVTIEELFAFAQRGNVLPISALCTVFAESEVITLVGEGKPTDEIAAGIEMAVAKRCFVMAKKAGATDSITLTGGCAKNAGLKQAIEHVLKFKVVELKTDPQLMGALGAAEYARQKGLAKK